MLEFCSFSWCSTSHRFVSDIWAPCEATYKGLQNTILKDQFFKTCDKPLHTFLKQNKKLDLTEMTHAADNYVKGHGYEMNW